ncbi:hypothetical protein [Actinomadura chokoriensis]|uniref:hypothetical protein n=1 Tax=Actinomadura chokoriensis TaxID=454156 RepID=UPI0031F97C9A
MHPLVVTPEAAEVVEPPSGGLVVVPPRLPHAFGAPPGTGADLLAVLTPGVERFGYLRRPARVRHGLEPFDGLRSEQDRYDVHFVDAEHWSSPRSHR